MSNKIEQVMVPDLGDANEVEVIEILVKPGDQVAVEDSIITLEGDKATMDIPSSVAGVVEEVQIKVGDKVKEGAPILTLKKAGKEKSEQANGQTEKPSQEGEKTQTAVNEKASGNAQEVVVPDIGDASNVDVIDVLVGKGDKVTTEDPLITLEGDKATMDVPAPFTGVVTEVKVKVGDKVSAGDLIFLIKDEEAKKDKQPSQAPASKQPKDRSESLEQPKAQQHKQSEPPSSAGADIHAGPAVRRIAHEYGVDLKQVSATGRKQRVLKEDIQHYIKQQLQAVQQGGSVGFTLPPLPEVDFAKFGEVETKPLTKIQKISGPALHRNWVTIPHITQIDEADITEMEAFRKSQKEKAAKENLRLTPLVFIMKAVVAALKAFPHFNASLDKSGTNLVLKKYYHIGVAVDTPNGLVVPVIRNVDKKGLFELAKELGQISEKAREKGLSLNDMQGGTFSISSLGGIGGTAFTPIINAPEVAILGVSRSQIKPVYQDNAFKPRLMLPLCLSYDHRVIDGADGARFIVHLSQCLSDIRNLLL